MTREYMIKTEEKFPISGQWYTNGKLLDQTECTILIDTGASKSYMSKSYYMRCKSLHALAKFTSTTQRMQVGNGQYVAVLFVISVIIDIYGHRFEVFTLVSEIHDNVDLVLDMKNVFELEGVIDMRDSSFKFLNRSLPFYSKDQVIVKPMGRKFIDRSTICRSDFRSCDSENVRQQRTVYSSVETKICKKLCISGCHK